MNDEEQYESKVDIQLNNSHTQSDRFKFRMDRKYDYNNASSVTNL